VEYVAGRVSSASPKGGREIWLQASYNPILDKTGCVTRIVKFATDITAAKQKAMGRRRPSSKRSIAARP